MRTTGTYRTIVVAVLVGLVALCGSAGGAWAGEPHPYLGLSFGRGASEPFADPNGIAIDETTGTVYVADIATSTVYKFDTNGTPQDFSALGSNALTGAGTPAHTFAFPSLPDTPAALAVDNSRDPGDPSRGDLYVMDASNGVIDKYNPAGEYLNQITGFEPATGSSNDELLGLAVDTNGTLHAHIRDLIHNDNGGLDVMVDEFDDSTLNRMVAEQRNERAVSATGQGLPGENQPLVDGYAVGATGDSFVLYGGSCLCAGKLGQQLPGLGEIDAAGAGDVALAADPATGHVYIDDQSSVVEWDTGAMNGGRLLPGSSSVEAVGALVSRFGSSQLSGASGQGAIAVDGASGRIYVSDPVEGKGEVFVFGSDTPAVVAGGPSNVTKQSVTLNGTVDPRGAQVTSCEFEYGVADEFGHVSGERYENEVPCQPGQVGAGTGPVAVSANIGGLEPGLLYRFRLRATNASALGESAGLAATQGEEFGVKTFQVSFLNEDGTADTQAGSHPYQLVNNIEFKTHYVRKESNADAPYYRVPNGTLKSLAVDLPPGFVGDPNATPKKCTVVQLRESKSKIEGKDAVGCPPEALLGGFTATWSPHAADGEIFAHKLEPVFNMVAARGVALQLGTSLAGTNVMIDNGVVAGGDYPVRASVLNAPAETPVINTRLTVSGVVGEGAERKAFLTLPTGCHGPLRSTISVESYQQPGVVVSKESVSRNAAGVPVSLTGCSKLTFAPTISVAPDSGDGSSSSGLTVGVHVPQTAALNPDGLAESSLRDTTVTLPEGVAINPAGGDGLQACSSDPGALGSGALGSTGDQIGYLGDQELHKQDEPGVAWNTFTPEIPSLLDPGSNFCPDASKVGRVKIKTPLLEHELEGAVYLAAQNDNPFGSLLGMYLVAEDSFSGSLIKLAGEVKLSDTGQITATFKNTPDLPFEDLQLHFFGGERAPLSTPARCGTYTTTAVFTPWDGNGPVSSQSSFNIDHGPHGGPCPGSSLPFDPSLAVGTTSNDAGGFSALSSTIGREDGQQNMQAVSLRFPPGLSGLLAGVTLCPEAQANEGTCPQSSLIGETTVAAGVGSDPVSVKGGRVYITEKYSGAPFGLSIVNPVKAGPFDLEHDTSRPASNMPGCDCIVVRARIEVDPLTAALTVTTDPSGVHAIPQMIDGIPVQIQKVNVLVNRQGFAFNPTSCQPMQVKGTITSSEGAAQAVSVPFQAADCASLKFQPKFAASTSGKASRANGASLTVRLSYPSAPQGTQANIRQVKVQLPKQLPSRLATLQKACTKAQFDSDPAGCPSASVVGHAKATTPLLPVPLEGPAYFVSNGNEAFPNLIMVLQGYGVTIDLVGDTFISKTGITSSTFKSVPDAPVGSFQLTLPQRPYSALAANGNLCNTTTTRLLRRRVKTVVHGHTLRRHGHAVYHTTTVKKTIAAPLTMPTEFTAQNGAQTKQNTPITVEGCTKTRHKNTGKRAPHKHNKR